MRLILNAIQCLSCDEVIVSRHRHDYKTCKCGKVSVDGGLEYRRRGFKTGARFVERCAYTYDPSSKSEIVEGKFIVWSPSGRTNPGVVFDHKEDATMSAKELAVRVPPADWYVSKLYHIPVK